jgi:uncharacterized membrane-anchored protein YitT (DUF2179 family)
MEAAGERTGRKQKQRRQSGLKGKDWLSFFAGTGLMAAAVQLVYDPSRMVPGGFSGIGILLRSLTAADGGIPVGLTTFLLNLPVFWWGYRKKGRAFVEKSLVCVIFFSLWLFALPVITIEEEDLLLAALLGGTLTGLGLGLVFRQSGSTGGTDMLALLLHTTFPSYSPVFILKLLDGGVVLLGAAFFGIPNAMYATLAVFVSSKVADRMLEGLYLARGVWIITGKGEALTEAILTECKRGVTGWTVEGGYTRQGKSLLLCVVGRREIIELKKLVHRLDPQAFLLIADVREVQGQGFRAP